MFSKMIREPLFQFLLIAFILLLAERLISGNAYKDDQYHIRIDDQVLVDYMQLRAKAFNKIEAVRALNAMSEDKRQQLTDDYIREEVLFREALALNLDNNDQLIRRRLIQKMEYLSQGFYDDIPVPTEADLTLFYQQNMELYRQPAEITFTHVFFKAKQADRKNSQAAALKLLDQLNIQKVPFENAPRYGERFMFNRNYVNREADEIASHFGETFQQQLFSLQVSNNWQGPIVSDYGWHLVLIKKITASYIPDLEQISATVLADLTRNQHQARLSQAVDQLIEQYQITIEPSQ